MGSEGQIVVVRIVVLLHRVGHAAQADLPDHGPVERDRAHVERVHVLFRRRTAVERDASDDVRHAAGVVVDHHVVGVLQRDHLAGERFAHRPIGRRDPRTQLVLAVGEPGLHLHARALAGHLVGVEEALDLHGAARVGETDRRGRIARGAAAGDDLVAQREIDVRHGLVVVLHVEQDGDITGNVGRIHRLGPVVDFPQTEDRNGRRLPAVLADFDVESLVGLEAVRVGRCDGGGRGIDITDCSNVCYVFCGGDFRTIIAALSRRGRARTGTGLRSCRGGLLAMAPGGLPSGVRARQRLCSRAGTSEGGRERITCRQETDYVIYCSSFEISVRARWRRGHAVTS